MEKNFLHKRNKKIFRVVYGICILANEKRYTQENALHLIKSFLNKNFKG